MPAQSQAPLTLTRLRAPPAPSFPFPTSTLSCALPHLRLPSCTHPHTSTPPPQTHIGRQGARKSEGPFGGAVAMGRPGRHQVWAWCAHGHVDAWGGGVCVSVCVGVNGRRLQELRLTDPALPPGLDMGGFVGCHTDGFGGHGADGFGGWDTGIRKAPTKAIFGGSLTDGLGECHTGGFGGCHTGDLGECHTGGLGESQTEGLGGCDIWMTLVGAVRMVWVDALRMWVPMHFSLHLVCVYGFFSDCLCAPFLPGSLFSLEMCLCCQVALLGRAAGSCCPPRPKCHCHDPALSPVLPSAMLC
eukprot:363319-Chlamydomonas_euryale.AAC.3